MQNNDIGCVALDSYEDPLDLVRQQFNFDGQTAVYLLDDPDEQEVVYVSSQPFTLEDVRRNANGG